jgi:predicted RNA-binding Zn-ribbon protein involved in translation (DUF1610 family)
VFGVRQQNQGLPHQGINMNKSQDARDLKTFKCPACGSDVEAELWRARGGMKCPSCGTGFIPEKIKTRELQAGTHKGSTHRRIILYGVLIVLAIGTGFISLWLAVAITIIVLLAAILVELSRNARK